MAKRFGSYKAHILDFFTKFAIGFGLGAGGDAVVEISRAPVLNDTGTFGDPNTSNYEYLTYFFGTAGTVLGVAALGLKGQGILGFTASAMPVFAGLAIGTYFYEHTLANLLGIRKFNPYELFGHLLPPAAGHPFPGSQVGGALHPKLPA